MKYLKILAGLALLVAVVLPAQAQQYNTGSFSTVVAASTTSNYTSSLVIGMTKYQDVGIRVLSTLAGSGTDNTTVKLARSIDGVTYETTPSVVITIANTGTTAVNTLTNIEQGAVGFLRLASVQDGDTGDALSATVQYVLKPQRNGK
jgi:hypothetical protein